MPAVNLDLYLAFDARQYPQVLGEHDSDYVGTQFHALYGENGTKLEYLICYTCTACSTDLNVPTQQITDRNRDHSIGEPVVINHEDNNSRANCPKPSWKNAQEVSEQETGDNAKAAYSSSTHGRTAFRRKV